MHEYTYAALRNKNAHIRMHVGMHARMFVGRVRMLACMYVCTHACM